MLANQLIRGWFQRWLKICSEWESVTSQSRNQPMHKIKKVSIAAAVCALATSISANASQILFAQVAQGGSSYVADGNRLAQFLTNAGHTVTTRYLDLGVYNDYSSFDDIFVYDLSFLADTSATQMANYSGIANWYNARADKNLILDGRIISSDVSWTNANGMSSEQSWIQNYATQLDLRGGGLMLGTDHDVYQSGINQINSLIGVGAFSGFFGTYPTSQAVVDPLSPLYLSSLDNCRGDATQKCVNDNSTTGFVATGLQANGQTLTPVAYHGLTLDAWDQAAVSSTFGSRTFGTCGNPGQPPCEVSVPEPSTTALICLGLLGIGFYRRRAAYEKC